MWAQFTQDYRDARFEEGWRQMTREQARGLPYGQIPGYPPLYWEVRRRSFSALMSILAREGPTPASGPSADLGAGNGWLSYRLAQAGYRVAAVEVSRDGAFGLGAAGRDYASEIPLFLVLGDLNHPPLQPGGLGMVIFNASLHYVEDLERTLRLSANALRPDGRLFVVDSPIARQPRPGSGRGDRHLGRQELQSALTNAGLDARWIEVRRGIRWARHRARAWLKREPIFSFPLVVADKA
jgi:SAM-dependent methyltransferase